MRTIIAGCRDIHRDRAFELIRTALNQCGWKDQITVILHGACHGVDTAAEEYCKGTWPIESFPADWRKHGKAAGPIRNREMASKADALIAIWDGNSKGTLNMIQAAEENGLRLFVYRTDRHLLISSKKELEGKTERMENEMEMQDRIKEVREALEKSHSNEVWFSKRLHPDDEENHNEFGSPDIIAQNNETKDWETIARIYDSGNARLACVLRRHIEALIEAVENKKT